MGRTIKAKRASEPAVGPRLSSPLAWAWLLLLSFPAVPETAQGKGGGGDGEGLELVVPGTAS